MGRLASSRTVRRDSSHPQILAPYLDITLAALVAPTSELADRLSRLSPCVVSCRYADCRIGLYGIKPRRRRRGVVSRRPFPTGPAHRSPLRSDRAPGGATRQTW